MPVPGTVGAVIIIIQVSLLVFFCFPPPMYTDRSYLGRVRRELPGKAQACCELRRHGSGFCKCVSAGTNTVLAERKYIDKKMGGFGGVAVENILPEGFLYSIAIAESARLALPHSVGKSPHLGMYASARTASITVILGYTPGYRTYCHYYFFIAGTRISIYARYVSWSSVACSCLYCLFFFRSDTLDRSEIG